MKIIKRMLFENRIGVYSFVLILGGDVWIIYKKFSDPETLYVVRAQGKILHENFFDAAGEVEDLTPMDVIVVAIKLAIAIPPEVATSLVGSSILIQNLAESLGIE